MAQAAIIQVAIKARKITFDSLIKSDGSESVLKENVFSNFAKLSIFSG